MIQRFTSLITKWLLKSGAISAEETDLYEYAISLVVFTVAPLLLAAIVGAAMGMFLESILLILPFLLIRKFSGGFHLESSLMCFIFSTLILIFFLWAIRVLVNWNGVVPFLIGLFLCLAILTIFSPIDSEARRLTESEKKLFKKIAIVLAYICAACSIFLIALGQGKAGFSIGAGIILSAILQIPCLIKKCFHS